MIYERSIRRGALGTRDTLALIDRLARQGGQLVPRAIIAADPSIWDSLLRRYWVYEEETEETLRTIPNQLTNLENTGKMYGDCDDAAIVGAAMAFACGFRYRLIALRPPIDQEFRHVLVEFGFTNCRMDPTAPVDANYSQWEAMMYP